MEHTIFFLEPDHNDGFMDIKLLVSDNCHSEYVAPVAIEVLTSEGPQIPVDMVTYSDLRTVPLFYTNGRQSRKPKLSNFFQGCATKNCDTKIKRAQYSQYNIDFLRSNSIGFDTKNSFLRKKEPTSTPRSRTDSVVDPEEDLFYSHDPIRIRLRE